MHDNDTKKGKIDAFWEKIMNMNDSLLEQTARVALAALIHDLGKLAERAGIEVNPDALEAHQQLYCPHHKDNVDARGWFSHLHAAYTGIAWDRLEATDHFPDLKQNSLPFGNACETDSAVNAAAAHHKPDSFLQWIVATADRVASGFEREKFDTQYNNQKERDNHYSARLLTLFEQLNLDTVDEGQLQWRYPLRPLDPESIFPKPAASIAPTGKADARAEYRRLWDHLLQEMTRIPRSHTSNLPLWLDHFDSLWLTITHAIPSATAFGAKPEVSLYDHGKSTAALSSALWRWHHENSDETASSIKEGWGQKKFLLIQGDFFGIQDFIFAEGGKTQKHAHKLLRGRSFQVSLLAECAALRLLEALQLPSTSQIINAAGKFLIVAPNTESARNAVARSRKQLNDWCLKHTYGEIGVGIATTEASCDDFTGGRFSALIQRLFSELDTAKHQRFDLCDNAASAVFPEHLDSFNNDWGLCEINGHHAADPKASARRGYALSLLANDQIQIGEALTRKTRLIVANEPATLPVLGLDYFGYQLAFIPEEDISGRYGDMARSGTIRRLWDFDSPDANSVLWHGYARRQVNAYVPIFTSEDAQLTEKYGRWQDEVDFDRETPIKTLHHIASEDRQLEENNRWYGKAALLTLKGDIDNLGALFQKGLEKPTFAKMAALSRQVNAFFALWLPWYCEHGKDANGIRRFRNTYTVFAGGDDFFLIGPWDSTMQLATVLQEKFGDYVRNSGITFSVGMVMMPPKTPVRQLARRADLALDAAKSLPGKNAVTLWDRTIRWPDWNLLMTRRQAALQALMARAGQHGADFSTGLVYTLLQLTDRAESTRPEDAIWRSQLHYRLARFFRDKVKGSDSARDRREQLLRDAIGEIGSALETHKGAYRLPLSVLLYRQRD